MKKQADGPKTRIRAPDGPIKPGAPLYRALEMVANEIAKRLENNAMPAGRRQGRTRP